eukprot:gene23358-24782_t
MLDRAIAFAPGEIDIGGGDVVLEIDEAVLGIGQRGARAGDCRNVAGRRADAGHGLAGIAGHERLDILAPVERARGLAVELDDGGEPARYGAAIWSGDVASRWYDLRAQISAGVNASMSGIPNWTHDIGGFALEDRFSTKTPTAANLEEWRELNLRWFQFGAFSPLFRSHGEYPYREIYEISPEGSPMRASMIRYDELRYRLMPYIYTVGADTYLKDGSIMRALAAGYVADRQVRRIDDEYLFGDAFLVAPVTAYKARSRSVYFPEGTRWYDFDTGRAYQGGTRATVDAPFERLPLFVRAGAIVPTGPVTQYVDERRDAPLTILVYPGADGSFSLYEDDGRSTAYKTGAYS